ncbi:MAG: hypothetical protein K0B87_00415 [Candidatus Syntrophosphaera sp.]|nr:hypothetical protein [Candidatus Syntrophosphaera sp.]
MRSGRIILLTALGLVWLGLALALSPVALMQYYWNAGDWDGAAELPFTPGEDVIHQAVLDASGLEAGLNHLHFRARNADGTWSLPQHRAFFRSSGEPLPSLVEELEWWLDTDPGPGNANSVSVAAGTDVQQLVQMATQGAALGLHRFGVRARNQAGNWSLPIHKLVFATGNAPLAEVVSAEWWLDEDPGEGGGQFIELADGADVQQAIVLALGDSPLGFHHLGIRVKNSAGNWGQPLWLTVFKPGYPDIADIQSITWYFTGPEVDESSSYQLPGMTPGQDVQADHAIPLTHLVQGETYFLHVYAISTRGQRSLEQVLKFTVDWIPDPQASIDGVNLLLAWDQIIGAASYRVLAADDPAGPYALLGITTNPLWTETVLNKRFFRVVAVSQ